MTKEQHAEYQREWAKKNREKVNQYQRNWRAKKKAMLEERKTETAK